MRIGALVAGVAMLLVPLSPVAARPASIAVADRFAVARAEIRAAMAADHVPGMSVAVYQGDRILWQQGFGLADIERKVVATPRTRYRIGSVSKVITATLAVRLAQQGLVDMDRPIRSYIPEWPQRIPPITLRQLLGHLSGIRHYKTGDFDTAALGGSIDTRLYPNRASILAIFVGDDLVARPGERFNYSTFGFTLAGMVLEAATRKDFDTLLHEQLLAPAHLERIAIDNPFRLLTDRSASYDPIEKYRGLVPATLGPVVNAMPLNPAYKVPGGGIIADAESLARFGALHFGPGFLRFDWYNQMFTPQRRADGKPIEVGLGWWIATDAAGRRKFQHSGVQQGSRAHLAVYPDQKLSIALLSNLGGKPDKIADLVDRIAATMLAPAAAKR